MADRGNHGAPADAWGTSRMAEALPSSEKAENGGNENKDAGEAHPGDFSNWKTAVPYDYAAFERRDDWAGNAKVYEWDGEMGDVGPEIPELEAEIFGDRVKGETVAGLDFSAIDSIELFQEGPERVQPFMKFEEAGLHPVMLKNVKLAGYVVPTPIQKFCLPAIHLGFDVIGIAQTGSGKTAAYLIPVLNKLMGKAKKLAAPRPCPVVKPGEMPPPPVRAEPLVVVVCPSRELAIQIFNEARKFCYRTMLRPCVIYGGGPIAEQVRMLAKGCDILIASPGRLIDFMDRPNILTLRRVKYMVIDEADEMLHDDWAEDFSKILSGGDQEEGNIKYLLFSATFPKMLRDLAKTHLAESHVRFRVGRAGSTHENIKQEIIFVDPYRKREAIVDLIKSMPPCRTIIFVNNKRTADELDDMLYNMGLPCTSMHSDRTQKEREDAMRAFRGGGAPILITTALTARGIDVRNVLHVINYDLPSMDHGGIEEYTHRIGRTGRIGHRGLASSFYCENDEPMASVLTRTLLETKQKIPDFLEAYVPEGEARENLKFEADSDWDENEASGAAGDGWGNSGKATGDAADDAWGGSGNAAAGDAWGSSGNAAAGDEWGTDKGAKEITGAPADSWGMPPAGGRGGGGGGGGGGW